MTGLDFVALATWSVMENRNLVALALLDDGRLDLGALHCGPAYLDVFAIGDEQDLIQLDRLADRLWQQLHANPVAHTRTKLLTAYLKDCVHDNTPGCLKKPIFIENGLFCYADKQKRPDLPGRWREWIITGMAGFVKH